MHADTRAAQTGYMRVSHAYVRVSHLRVVAQRGLALLAPDAGRLVAAEGNTRVKLVPCVHPHRAGLQRARNRVGHRQILCENASRQAVLGVVCAADHLAQTVGSQALTVRAASRFDRAHQKSRESNIFGVPGQS